MQYELVTAPSEEPITLAEAKLHLRVDGTDEDSLITDLIGEAREWVEQFTRRALCTQTVRLWLDGFRDEAGTTLVTPRQIDDGSDRAIVLDRSPVVSVSNLKYIDTAGTLQTLDPAAYTLSAKSKDRPGFVVPAYGYAWPSTRDIPNCVQVEFVAGYGAAAAVPGMFKRAMRLHVGWGYASREPESKVDGILARQQKAIEQLLISHRVFQFG